MPPFPTTNTPDTAAEADTVRAWTAVCVSRISNRHAALALRDAMDRSPVEGKSILDLGQYQQQFAVEVDFDSNRDGAAALRTALADRVGTNGDIAVMPDETREKRLLICDMDSTIIEQECLDELADFAGLKAEVSAITERAMRGELDFEAALTERVAMLEGLPLDTLARCFADRISLSAGAKVLVETMSARGAGTLLVSGGFTFFTERVAEMAGFVEHKGNLLLDDGAALTGTVGLPILGREAKLSALEAAVAARGLSPSDALAMGDGANDLAMISAAGLGIAYRAKPIVAAEADAAIQVCDLTAALFFQGISAGEFVGV